MDFLKNLKMSKPFDGDVKDTDIGWNNPSRLMQNPEKYNHGEVRDTQVPNDMGGPNQDLLGPGTSQSSTDPDQSISPSSLSDYNEPEIVRQVMWTLEREYRSRRPHEITWDRAWDLYNNRYNFSKKADWQSQRALPKVPIAVERLTSIWGKQLIDDWFSIKTGTTLQGTHMNFIKETMHYFLEHPDVNFQLQFIDACKAGLLSELMPILVTSDPVPEAPPGLPPGVDNPFEGMSQQYNYDANPSVTNKRWIPRIEVLNPYRIFKDGNNTDLNQRFIIRAIVYGKEEFLQEAKKRSFRNVEEVMHSAAVATGSRSEYPNVEYREQRNKDQNVTVNPEEKTLVKLTEYWGTLAGTDGEALFVNSWCIVANGRYVVMGPEPIPFAHGKPPILAPAIIRVPFSPYGKSLIGISADSVELWVEFLNLLIDQFQRSLLGMFEIDEDSVDDDTDPTVFYPGKVWRRNQNADPSQPVVRPIQVGTIDPAILQFIGLSKSEMEDALALSGQTGVQPRQGRMSAMQATRQSSQAGSLLDYMLRTMEQTLLAPFLNMFLMTILQYMPQNEWDAWVADRAERMQGQGKIDLMSLVGKDSDWRVDNLGRGMRFSVRVFSAISDRQSELEKFSYIMGILPKIPGAMQHINVKAMMKKIIEQFGWDYEEFIVESPLPMPADPFTGQPIDAMAQQQAQQQAQMAQQGQAPGGGGAPGTSQQTVPTGPPNSGSSNPGNPSQTPRPSAGGGP